MGDNDCKSKRFCSKAVLNVSFTRYMVKVCMIKLRVIEGPNTRDQIAFSPPPPPPPTPGVFFIPLILSGNPNEANKAGYICALHA